MVFDAKAYRWRIYFVHAHGADGNWHWQSDAPAHKFNPNDPPESFGIPHRIQLVPVEKYEDVLPALEMEIPAGCKPVFHALKQFSTAALNKLTGLSFRIGWQKGTLRTMKSVNMSTTEIIDMVDNEGK